MNGALDCAHAREVAQAARDLRVSEKTLHGWVSAHREPPARNTAPDTVVAAS